MSKSLEEVRKDSSKSLEDIIKYPGLMSEKKPTMILPIPKKPNFDADLEEWRIYYGTPSIPEKTEEMKAEEIKINKIEEIKLFQKEAEKVLYAMRDSLIPEFIRCQTGCLQQEMIGIRKDMANIIQHPEKVNKEIKNLNEKMTELSYKVGSIDHYQDMLFTGLKNNLETFQNIDKTNKSQDNINDGVAQSIERINNDIMWVTDSICNLSHQYKDVNTETIKEHTDTDTDTDTLNEINQKTEEIEPSNKYMKNTDKENMKTLYQVTNNISSALDKKTPAFEDFVKTEFTSMVRLLDALNCSQIRGNNIATTEVNKKITDLNQEISTLSDRMTKLEQTNITLTKHVHATESNLQFLYDAFTHAQSILTCSSSWIKSDVSELADLVGENVDLGMDNTGW